MICLRCKKEFENPIPPITNTKGVEEIATVRWCADCNALTMSVLYRGGSAYDILPTKRKGGLIEDRNNSPD